MGVIICSIVIYCILLSCLIYTLINRKFRSMYVPVKMVCSAAFIGAAFLYAYIFDNFEALVGILPALFFCFLGDFFMGLHNKNRNMSLLFLGAIFFISAHGFFIVYLLRLQSISVIDFIMPIVGSILVVIVLSSDAFKLKGSLLRFPAAIYAFFVTGLMSKSLMIAYTDRTVKNFLFALGAVLFLISDYLILVMYFKKKRGWTSHGFNIGTYYAAMLFIVLSICFK